MRTIYNVKALCVVALLSLAVAASARENVTKERNLNREMTPERECDLSIQDASEVNTLPVVKEPEVCKIPIDHSNYAIAADPQKKISLLPSGNIMTQVGYNKRRGCFNFGMGTCMNISGGLGYHILNTEKDQLNLWYSHRPTNGEPKDYGVRAKINSNLEGINYKYAFKKTIFSTGTKYGCSAFNYYGVTLPDSTSNCAPLEDLLQKDRETNQVNQTIAATIGFESKEEAKVGYLLDLGYTNFSCRYGLSRVMDDPAEHILEIKFDLDAGFDRDMRVGLGGLVEHFNYSLSEVGGYGYEFKNHVEAMLSPYYRVEGDNWSLKLGANVMLATDDETEFMAPPNVAADVGVTDETELRVNAGDKMYSDSMYEMSRVSRYFYPMAELLPSRSWLDAALSTRSGVIPGLWFDVFAGYKITNDDMLFTQSDVWSADHFGSFSVAEPGIDTRQLFVGANLKHSYQQRFDIALKGVYNNWKAETDEGGLPHARGKPEMELNANLTICPIEKLSAALDYYLATGRYANVRTWGVNGNTGMTYDRMNEFKMDNVNELNLTGAYTFNDISGVYNRLTSILYQKYELYYGYPMQNFNAMLGVNINF